MIDGANEGTKTTTSDYFKYERQLLNNDKD